MGETEDATAMAGSDAIDTRADPPPPPPPAIITPGVPLGQAPSSPSPSATAEASSNADPPLSKNARKRLLKAQLFQDTRESWKAHKREKRKAHKAALKERKCASAFAPPPSSTQGKRPGSPDGEGESEGEGEGPSLAAGAGTGVAPRVKRVKRQLEPITIILDCAFDDLMAEKEIKSLSSQLVRCYSANRVSPRQVSLQITSLTGRLLERFETTLSSQHLRWKNVTCTSSPYEVTPDLVYLTADSPNTIAELEDGKRYVIGGIVDKNRHKMLCYNKAVEQGVQTAKLPIGDYVKMASRFVLTTNQVVEIMIKWLECRDWRKAFLEVIPQRKMPEAKKTEGEASGGEEEPEGDDGADQGEGDSAVGPGDSREQPEEEEDETLAPTDPGMPEPNVIQGTTGGGPECKRGEKLLEKPGQSPGTILARANINEAL